MHGRALRRKARALRLAGTPLSTIAYRLSISKSTASLWLRDVVLSATKQRALRDRSAAIPELATLAKRRSAERTARWGKEAEATWRHAKADPLFLLAVGLYWGEGAKTQKRLELSNSDPDVIRLWMKWCRRYLPKTTRYRLDVQIHEDVDVDDAKRVWARVTGLRSTTVAVVKPRSSKRKQRRLIRYGTARILVRKGSAEWFTKMMTWIRLAKRF